MGRASLSLNETFLLINREYGREKKRSVVDTHHAARREDREEQRMPKRHQEEQARSSTGNNNPSKTTEGTHNHSENEITHKADSRARAEDHEKRSGSDSNANKHRKGSRLHEHDRAHNQPAGHEENDVDFSHDLEPNNFAGENRGPSTLNYSQTANDIKELHTILADLTSDERKTIVLVSEGSRLEQGAKYIDLKHLEQGEFTAKADMVATPDHYYVPKKEIDYVLWNRLNQVDNATRLDETQLDDVQ